MPAQSRRGATQKRELKKGSLPMRHGFDRVACQRRQGPVCPNVFLVLRRSAVEARVENASTEAILPG